MKHDRDLTPITPKLEKLILFLGSDKKGEVVAAAAAIRVGALKLPTRPAKRTTKADELWPYSFVAEHDAIPPDTLRAMVRSEVENYLPADELGRLKAIEATERETLLTFIGSAA